MELRYQLQKDMEQGAGPDRGDRPRVREDLRPQPRPRSTPTAATTPISSSSRRGRRATRPAAAVDELRRPPASRRGTCASRSSGPSPSTEVREVLQKVKKAAVVDRNCSYGAGGIFCQEVKSAALRPAGHAGALRLHRRARRARHHRPIRSRRSRPTRCPRTGPRKRSSGSESRNEPRSQKSEKVHDDRPARRADGLRPPGLPGLRRHAGHALHAQGPRAEDDPLHPGLLLGRHRRAVSLFVAWTVPSTTARSRRPRRRRRASRPAWR
ncbi:MAG: hypothetical protein MZV64_10880 [Ignavibacteriales bacterium]|nr:hypothetical protein [Ignavibacteriales bacterium]